MAILAYIPHASKAPLKWIRVNHTIFKGSAPEQQSRVFNAPPFSTFYRGRAIVASTALQWYDSEIIPQGFSIVKV